MEPIADQYAVLLENQNVYKLIEVFFNSKWPVTTAADSMFWWFFFFFLFFFFFCLFFFLFFDAFFRLDKTLHFI